MTAKARGLQVTTMLVSLTMALGLALPALSAGPFTQRETGINECGPFENGKTKIDAYGDHKHWYGGATITIDVSDPWLRRVSSYSAWGPLGTWKLYNQTGWTYYTGTSDGWCV